MKKKTVLGKTVLNKAKVTKLAEIKGFTSYLQSKGLAPSTITHYIDYTEKFFTHIGKEVEQVAKPDIFRHLKYLKDRKGNENITRKNHLIALNHYFTFLYQNEQLTENPCLLLKIRGTKKKTLYKIFTTEQLHQLYDNYYHVFIRAFDDSRIPKNQRQQSFLSRQRNYIMLGMLIYQGLSTNELQKISLGDVDMGKATIKIQGSKRSNERTLLLQAPQIGFLINYTQNILPQFFDFYTLDSDKLFLPLPESGKTKTDSQNLMHTFKLLTKQVKSIEPNFLNFKQIRASVITFWLKTQGLRKAQYLAGHRYISSTEYYLPNNLEGLTDDISKLHPF